MSNTGRTGTPEESLKILVVDDEPAMVGALGALLGQAGHRIVAAYDGEEALRRFHEDEPDLVLLDLAMPGLDGATVCQRIRESSDVEDAAYAYSSTVTVRPRSRAALTSPIVIGDLPQSDFAEILK